MGNEIKSCVCKSTRKNIGCEDCIQPIIDQDINKKNCNLHPESIESSLKKKELKFHRQRKQLKEELKCDCGNVIKMFNDNKSVKCFNCNFYWDKNDNGKWEKSQYKTTKDTLTLGDIVVKIRRRRK